jgi:cytochrome c1
MPRLPVTDQEMDDLVAFLEWTSGIDTQGWPPQDQRFRNPEARRAMALGVTTGAMLFQAKGCFDCHRLHQVGGDQGPDLTQVGARLTEETIAKILIDPASANPKAAMPPPELTEAERGELTRFLAGLK